MGDELLPGLEALNAAIARLYDATVNPELWPEALDNVVNLCGACGITVFPIVDKGLARQPVSPFYVSADVQEAGQVYYEEWIERCPINIYFERNPTFDRPVFDVDVLDETIFRRDPFYNEFGRYYQFMHGVMRATRPSATHAGFAMISAFSRTDELPSASKLKVFEILSGHAARAIVMHAQLAGQDNTFCGLAELLANQNCGVFLIDTTGGVVEANSRAMAMCGDGFRLGQRQLRACVPGDQPAMDQLLARALNPDFRNIANAPVALRRPNGKKPILINAIPLRRRPETAFSGLLHAGNGALVVAIDPDASDAKRSQNLFALSGLTPTESRLASIIGSGISPEYAAEIAGMSVGTVRNHLKRIFSKLDISRQGELVALAGKLSIINDGSLH